MSERPTTLLPDVDALRRLYTLLGTKDEIAGKVHETKGAIKERVGRATNNPDLEDEGTTEKIAGKIQKKVGQVEKVIEKP